MSALSQKGEPSCEEYLSSVSIPSPVFIGRDHTVLMTGALLSFRDVNCGILIEEGEVKHAIYGYQIVNFLLSEPPQRLYLKLFEPVTNIKEIAPGSPLPVLKISDPFRKALSEIVATRFGNLLLTDAEGRAIGLPSLETMLQAVEGRSGKVGMTLKEVASPLILATNGQTILDVFKSMMTNRVRRIVVKTGRKHTYCTEREILRVLFSLNGLESTRDNGAKILSQPVGKLPQQVFRPAIPVDGETDVAKAWTLVREQQSSTLIVDGDLIATPWDLVVKPFLAGKIPF